MLVRAGKNMRVVKMHACTMLARMYAISMAVCEYWDTCLQRVRRRKSTCIGRYVHC